MSQKGLTPILIVLLIALALGGYFLYQQQTKSTPPSSTPPTTYSTPQPSPSPSDTNPVPNGTGETANWKTYTIQRVLTFKYPPNYVIKNSMPGVVTVADKEADFGPAQTSITIDTRMTGVAANYNEAIRLIKGNLEQLPNGVKTTYETEINLNNVNQKMEYTNIYYKYKEGAIIVIYGNDQVGSRRYDQILSTFKFLP